jgi:hypothetical protein
MATNGLKRKKYRILMWKPDGKRPFGRSKRKYDENVEARSRQMCFEEEKLLGFYRYVSNRGFGTSGIRWGIGIVLVLPSERTTVKGHISFRLRLIAYPSRGKSWYQLSPATSSRYNILFGPRFVTCE